MKISAWDMLTNERIELKATLTTDHPVSSYGQPVMVIKEWNGDVMSHQNWVLAGCQVLEISEGEQEGFRVWYRLIEQGGVG